MLTQEKKNITLEAQSAGGKSRRKTALGSNRRMIRKDREWSPSCGDSWIVLGAPPEPKLWLCTTFCPLTLRNHLQRQCITPTMVGCRWHSHGHQSWLSSLSILDMAPKVFGFTYLVFLLSPPVFVLLSCPGRWFLSAPLRLGDGCGQKTPAEHWRTSRREKSSCSFLLPPSFNAISLAVALFLPAGPPLALWVPVGSGSPSSSSPSALAAYHASQSILGN